MSSVDHLSLSFIHQIDIDEASEAPAIHVAAWSSLKTGDRTIPVAKLTLDIGKIKAKFYYPWLPECKLHLSGLYNYATAGNSRSLELRDQISQLTLDQRLRTKGLACALLQATLVRLVKDKLISRTDFVWLEASGSIEKKCDYLNLAKYYQSLGFQTDPNYLKRFIQLYREHKSELSDNGCFQDEYREEYMEYADQLAHRYQNALQNRLHGPLYEIEYQRSKLEMEPSMSIQTRCLCGASFQI